MTFHWAGRWQIPAVFTLPDESSRATPTTWKSRSPWRVDIYPRCPTWLSTPISGQLVNFKLDREGTSLFGEDDAPTNIGRPLAIAS